MKAWKQIVAAAAVTVALAVPAWAQSASEETTGMPDGSGASDSLGGGTLDGSGSGMQDENVQPSQVPSGEYGSEATGTSPTQIPDYSEGNTGVSPTQIPGAGDPQSDSGAGSDSGLSPSPDMGTDPSLGTGEGGANTGE